MKTVLSAFLFLAGSMLVVSCSKDDNNNTPARQAKLSKMNYGSLGTYTYTYGADGRMSTESYSGSAGNPAYTVTFLNYDNKNRLVEFMTDYAAGGPADMKSTVSFTTDGRIERISNFNVSGSGPLLSYIIYDYPAGKYIMKSYSGSGTLLSNNEYTLTPDGKNFAEVKYYSGATLNATQTFSNYDNKKNNTHLFPEGYGARILSVNNYQASTTTIASSGAVISNTFTYEYNNDGYPTKRTSSSGAVNTFEYTW